jgi:flagellar biosynthesis/type III secretory pathway M-ring protein FliF/YscJ
MLSDGPMRLEDVLAELPDVEPRRRRSPQVDIPEIEEHTDIKLESIRDMIDHSPESVALLVKGWMADEVGV